ncbi:MAG: hypothetical protein KDD44_13590 [Bdellovibrionales bacterium]|nr:hypothetical protein [Bdellovibrionales bacterium]
MKRSLLLIIILLGLASCGSRDSAPPQGSKSNPLVESIKTPIDKANAARSATEEREQRQRSALEDTANW